jgi:hypothetical protein
MQTPPSTLLTIYGHPPRIYRWFCRRALKTLVIRPQGGSQRVIVMLSFMIGVIMTGSGLAALAYLRPRDGVIHRLARPPIFDWLVPIAIVMALALGVASMVSSIVA